MFSSARTADYAESVTEALQHVASGGIVVFTSSASVFAEARAVWCQAGLVGGKVVVNRFSETYCFYLFLMIIMIIPLMRGADRNHGELHPKPWGYDPI